MVNLRSPAVADSQHSPFQQFTGRTLDTMRDLKLELREAEGAGVCRLKSCGSAISLVLGTEVPLKTVAKKVQAPSISL